MTDTATRFVQNVGLAIFVPGYGKLEHNQADDVPSSPAVDALIEMGALRPATKPRKRQPAASAEEE